MKPITDTKLKEILRLHSLWLEDDPAGQRADLSGAYLSRANLSYTNLSRANLSGADLSYANLSRADLSYAILSVADLSGASLSGANLSRADLSYANLYGANLSRANLSGAYLYGANLCRANLSGTILENKPILSFQFNRHTAQYFGDGVLQIGCHKHSLEEWAETYEAIGKEAGYSEQEILAYGEIIKLCNELSKELSKWRVSNCSLQTRFQKLLKWVICLFGGRRC